MVPDRLVTDIVPLLWTLIYKGVIWGELWTTPEPEVLLSYNLRWAGPHPKRLGGVNDFQSSPSR